METNSFKLASFFMFSSLSCERCKKLRNGIKKATLMELPEVLTVHLKRFRHEMNCSTKISNRVTFPLTGLNLRPYACSGETRFIDKPLFKN